jgi:hypothetical protein
MSKDYSGVDLSQYTETKFYSNSPTFKRMFGQLIDGLVKVNDTLYELLATNNYRGFDDYILKNEGRVNFLNILQQIFMFKYFLPSDKPPLTYKQIQNALGIQQARWSSDSENKNTYPLGNVHFHYYQELVPTYDSPFNKALMDYRKGGVLHKEKMYPEWKEKTEEEQLMKLFELLQDTVWYSYDKEPFLEMYKTGKPCRHFWIREPRVNYEDPPDEELLYCNCYPLPESFSNLCEMACLHSPELIFGALSSPSIVKYYIFNEKRPFHCHLATENPSKANFTSADGANVHLLSFWTHDMQHEALGECSPDNVLDIMNRKLRRFATRKKVPYIELTSENIKEQFEDAQSILNTYIETEKGNEEDETFLSVTDQPGVWSSNGRTKCFKGGKRSKNSKNRKTRKNKKTRKQKHISRKRG